MKVVQKVQMIMLNIERGLHLDGKSIVKSLSLTD